MPRSILTYAEHRGEPTHLIVIGLHGFGENQDHGLQLARCVGEDILAYAPVSPRPVSPRFSEGHTAHNEKQWFFQQGAIVEPTLFGDNLRQLESFLFDVIDREADIIDDVQLLIVGRDQGAALALVLASLWPELIQAVAAIDGYVPRVPAWNMPDSDQTGQKIALIYTADRDTPPELVRMTHEQLQSSDAEVRLSHIESEAVDDSIRGIRSWLVGAPAVPF